jgi:membrane-bound serine protease (ClpP class)
MRGPLLLLCAFLALALMPVAAHAASPSPTADAAPTKVVVLNVQGAIDAPLLSFLDEQLDVAQSEGAVVVLQLNTSGTLNQDGVALGDRLVALRVPVLAWVGPAPAKAAGAGLLLMYASSIAGVSPGSQTGPLNPVDLAHPDRTYPSLETTIRGWIAARQKDTKTDWVDRPLPGATALSYGIAQVAATSVPDFLHQVDGKTVQTAAGPVVLHTTIATKAGEHSVDVTFDDLGPVKRVEHGVASPSIIYFLLVLGLACLAFELTQPGFGFAGFAGVGMLALAVFGITEIPPTWLGLALLLAGVGLMTLDVRLRKLGVLTAIGLVTFVAGSLLAWNHVAHAIRISPWLIGGATIASLLYYGFALTVAIQSRDRIVNTQRGLIGLVGEARGRLAPEGPVFVKGAMWRGRTGGDAIAAGTPVRVRGVDGLVLTVEPEPAPPPPDV